MSSDFITQAEVGMKKRCTRCEEWKERKDFYRTVVKGRQRDKDGRYFRKSICKRCQIEQDKEKERNITPEERDRRRKILRARRRAYRRLAAINEEGFRLLLMEELRDAGIENYRYTSPNGEYSGYTELLP